MTGLRERRRGTTANCESVAEIPKPDQATTLDKIDSPIITKDELRNASGLIGLGKPDSISSDKIVVLRDGVIEQVGSPLELYNNPLNLFVAGFIGSPKMNIVDGAHADELGAHTIGIRPEHILSLIHI